MDLNAVLDDIQGNLPAVDKDHPDVLKLPEDDVPPEKLNDAVINSDDDPLNAETIGALESFKTCLIYRKAINERDVLDKSLATEVFTMIPEMDNPLLMSKLTNAASAHNKSLLLGQLDGVQSSPESMLPMFNQIYGVIERTLADLALIQPVAQRCSQEVDAECTRIGLAVVVFCRKQYDVLAAPISDLMMIDDRVIDYPPYEGVFSQALQDIVYTKEYARLSELTKTWSILDLKMMLKTSVEASASIEQSLQSALSRLSQFNEDTFTQIDLQDLLRNVERITQYKNRYITDTSFIEALMKFLRLLK